jgi:hypothetical protein
MVRTPVPRSTPPLPSRRFATMMLFSALTWGTSAVTQAAPLGLTFAGTVDLSAFGASSTSTFGGSFTWDPYQPCGPGGGGEGDFPLSSLDGDPPCVTAALRVNSISHNDFEPELSRLMLFANGMVLQLWFVPPVDLDGGAAPDALLIELELWHRHDPDRRIFPDIGELPSDRSFLRHLPDRSFHFLSEGCFEVEGDCARASADTLTVVPEPSSTTFLLVTVASAGVWMRRRSRTPQIRPEADAVSVPLQDEILQPICVGLHPLRLAGRGRGVPGATVHQAGSRGHRRGPRPDSVHGAT